MRALRPSTHTPLPCCQRCSPVFLRHRIADVCARWTARADLGCAEPSRIAVGRVSRHSILLPSLAVMANSPSASAYGMTVEEDSTAEVDDPYERGQGGMMRMIEEI
eukprot:3793045-Pyramimonas_sp.AAC.1